MPYSSTKQLPPAAKNLPEPAKKIWLAAFNASFEKYGEQKAFAIAMAAVKNKYRQVNGKWVAKDDAGDLFGDRDYPLLVKTMPAAAKSIFKAQFRKSLKEEPEELAALLAIAAVRKEFVMEGEEWVKKEEAEAQRALEAAELASAAGGAGEAADDPDGEGGQEATGEGEKATGEARGASGEASGEGGTGSEGGGYTKKTKTTEVTETRGGDSIQVTETFALDAATSERFGLRTAPSGFLTAEPRVARTGIQLYKGSEVGMPDMEVVRVYRPEAEVFDKRAMASLAHRTVTLDHPQENVDPSNWKRYSVGHSTGDVTRDGEYIRVPLALMDAAAISAVKSGKSQLSVGYGARLVWGEGETSDGQLYDAMQTDIRANHIALVATARGGDKLRMGDRNGSHDRRSKPMTERTLNLDGVNITVEDKDGQILERHLTELRKQVTDAAAKAEATATQVAELSKAVGVKDGEIAALKQSLEDGKLTPDKLDKALNLRMEVVDRATTYFGDQKYQWQNKTDAQIRRDVVAARMGDQKAKAMNDDAVEGAFLSITETEQQDGFQQMTRSFSRPPVGNIGDAAAKAYDKRNEDLQNRWRRNKTKATA